MLDLFRTLKRRLQGAAGPPEPRPSTSKRTTGTREPGAVAPQPVAGMQEPPATAPEPLASPPEPRATASARAGSKPRPSATAPTLAASGAKPTAEAIRDIRALVERDISTWETARARAAGGQRVLFATNVTGFQHTTLLEASLALALTLRGAEVDFVVCDAALPACLRVEPSRLPDPTKLVDGHIGTILCGECQSVGRHYLDALGLRRWQLSELITTEDRHEVAAQCALLGSVELAALTTPGGDKVGMHGLAGALRYFARAELPHDDVAVEVLRCFVAAALLTSRAYDRLLATRQYDVAVFHHGI